MYRGVNIETNEAVAIKMIERKRLDEEEYMRNGLMQEIKVMKKLNSDNIVRFIDVLETKNNYYIVQEFCNEGDFRSFLSKNGPLSEDDAKEVLHDVLSGFVELLKHGILHRDLKPENILISRNTLPVSSWMVNRPPILLSRFYLPTCPHRTRLRKRECTN